MKPKGSIGGSMTKQKSTKTLEKEIAKESKPKKLTAYQKAVRKFYKV